MGANTATPRKRDVALAFIMERIARTGRPPSLREIGHELKVSVTRVQTLLGQLERDGAIERTPGVQMGIRLRDVAASREHLTEVLRRLGFVEPLRPFTDEHLPLLAQLDQLPSVDWPGTAGT